MNFIEYDTQDRIGYITLNRPEKRNALSHEMVTQLKETFTIAQNDDSTKVIVLRARGDAFCAGADLEYLKQLEGFSYEQNLADSSHLKELFYQIYTLRKVVIAQIQGHALAGGCGLATVCDFSFAVPEANFGYTEVRIGFIPAIVMVFLVRKIGEAKARALLLSGSLCSAHEAQEMGLINEVMPGDQLGVEVADFAKQLIESNSAYSMSVTKQMIAKVQSLPLDEALDFAAEMNAKARASDDCKKGISAFLNKQKINW